MKGKQKAEEQVVNGSIEMRHLIDKIKKSEYNDEDTVQALKEIEARYSALFDRILYCVYIHDFKGNFLEANDTALNLLGYMREEIPFVNFSSILIEDQMEKAFRILEETKRTGSLKSPVEFKLRKKNGVYVWIEAEGSVIYQHGKPYAIQGIARDITERKRAEETLKERERQLRIKTDNLEEANIALKVLLKRRDEDRKELEEKVLLNIKKTGCSLFRKIESNRIG